MPYLQLFPNQMVKAQVSQLLSYKRKDIRIITINRLGKDFFIELMKVVKNITINILCRKRKRDGLVKE